MKRTKRKQEAGFSLVELMLAMIISMLLLGMVSILMTKSFGTRQRETQRTDAMASAKAALNIMSREVANAGYGLTTNGIVVADCDSHKMRFRSNVENSNSRTNSASEDVTYYRDVANKAIVRFDPNASPQTSVVLSGVTELNFEYYDYTIGSSTPVQKSTPSNDTGKVKINVTIELDDVVGQVNDQQISFTSEVTLRNSKYMLKLY